MNSNKIFIDAHIHIHDCHDLGDFFNSAKKNFENQANISKSKDYQSVLFLTESHNVNYFNKLIILAENNEKIINWEIKLTNNENSLVLTDSNNFNMFLIAGRQIVTKENLEILALGLTDDPNDGDPILDVLSFVNDKELISVIPWGVGKWFSSRRQIVENLVLQNKAYPIYLGDNGNRPFFWNKPNLFKIAADKGIFNLPGSDPLPFDKEVKKPGSFGFIIDEVLNEDKPFDSIYKIISSSNIQFDTFGKLESTLNFIKNQVSMQIVKRNR